jgi:TonB family protein
MLELNPKRTVNSPAQVGKGTQQSHRLLLALVLLLAALGAVLVKDRDFWFGAGSSTIEADVPETSTPTQAATKSSHPAQPVQSHTTKKQVVPAVKPEEPKPAETPAVTTKRTILPALDVEVVAGSTHKNVHPGSNAQRLEITDPNGKPAMQPATKAAEHESLAADAKPIYPPLAQHMNVQGSVILQAVIGTDGVIQNLQILRGPAILARAAEQAVREWHFKPIVQNGQAVESKATITVNFTIKVADNSAETTVAEMQAAERLTISR